MKGDRPDFHKAAVDALGLQHAKNPVIALGGPAESGFEFKDLARAARQELMVCGQNLHFLSHENNREAHEEIIREMDARGAKLKVLMCDPEYEPHIKPWAYAVGANAEDYCNHLVASAKQLREWDHSFENVEVRVAPFVPTSVLFIDAHLEGRGFAVVTLHHFQKASRLRPIFVVSGEMEDNILGAFYEGYSYVWNDLTGRTRHIGQVDCLACG